MASIDYQNSILWRGEDPLKRKFKPAYDNSTRVGRYWPGKAPSWLPNEGGEDKTEKQSEKPPTDEKGSDLRRETRKHEKRRKTAGVVLEDTGNSRLKRLSACQGPRESGTERLLRHRAVSSAQVLEPPAEEKEELLKEESLEEQSKEETLKEEPLKEELLKEERDEDILRPKVEDVAAEGGQPVAELACGRAGGDEVDEVELRALRREKARAVALEQRKQEEDLLKKEQDAGLAEEVAEEESEEESGSEDEDPRRAALLKPVFVSKLHRETVREKEAMQREEEEAEKKQREKQKERKAESKGLLIDEIKRDEEIEREGLNENDASDIELIDDNDEKNEAEEYELWKIRELKRIKRDKEERMARQKEIEWIMKRRAMTEEEREADDRRLDEESQKRDDTKQFNFLQKYYHRGGFFQDKAAEGDEPLYLRDYHEPLEEEKFDKKLLPRAMQLRRGQFGKKGQVKHTHLTEVDTTDFQAAWSQHSKQVQRYQERMAGARGVNNFDRPSASSKGI